MECRDRDALQPIGGPVPSRTWSVRTLGGELIVEGGDSVGFGRGCTPEDYFLALFPQTQLSLVSILTSAKPSARRLAPTTPGQVLKFFGVLLLATRFEFGSQADLWATTSSTKHMSAPAFGARTGLSRNRFDDLWSNLVFSRQPAGGPAEGAGGTVQFR